MLWWEFWISRAKRENHVCVGLAVVRLGQGLGEDDANNVLQLLGLVQVHAGEAIDDRLQIVGADLVEQAPDSPLDVVLAPLRVRDLVALARGDVLDGHRRASPALVGLFLVLLEVLADQRARVFPRAAALVAGRVARGRRLLPGPRGRLQHRHREGVALRGPPDPQHQDLVEDLVRGIEVERGVQRLGVVRPVVVPGLVGLAEGAARPRHGCVLQLDALALGAAVRGGGRGGGRHLGHGLLLQLHVGLDHLLLRLLRLVHEVSVPPVHALHRLWRACPSQAELVPLVVVEELLDGRGIVHVGIVLAEPTRVAPVDPFLLAVGVPPLKILHPLHHRDLVGDVLGQLRATGDLEELRKELRLVHVWVVPFLAPGLAVVDPLDLLRGVTPLEVLDALHQRLLAHGKATVPPARLRLGRLRRVLEGVRLRLCLQAWRRGRFSPISASRPAARADGRWHAVRPRGGEAAARTPDGPVRRALAGAGGRHGSRCGR
mmetsp:Transcript_101682/g.287888  ORF Transcript_101682/g.287888 Transcript_101682/m.287888 type:complete len:489 (-) Transcript_101682:104-1570(-)